MPWILRSSWLWVALLLTLGVQGLWAVPAPSMPSLVSQPDGTQFFIQTRGDEWYRYHTTMSGIPLMRDEGTGIWHFAAQDGSGQLVTTNIEVTAATLKSQPAGLSAVTSVTIPPDNLSRKIEAASLGIQNKLKGLLKNGIGLNATINNPTGTIKGLVIQEPKLRA